MRRSLVAPLSSILRSPSTGLVCHSPEMNRETLQPCAPTAWKQHRWQRRLDLICTSGQRRTNILVVRTYARWPLRASGVLDPLARRVKKAAGPAVNVEACRRSVQFSCYVTWVRMATCFYVMARMRHLYKFTISHRCNGAWKTSSFACAHAGSRYWWVESTLGTMSASAYIENLA